MPPTSSPTHSSPNYYDNSYLTKEQAQEFVSSISPPRDLTCPITLTIFHYPVIALGDGHTYEKHAIQTWLRSQQSGGTNNTIRSPVTNSYMEGNVMSLIDNKIVADMARHFRENLGVVLCRHVESISGNSALGDGGFRIRTLVEMGADLSVKGRNGNTALMTLVQEEQLDLVRFFLSHNSPLTILNDERMNCADVIRQKIQHGRTWMAWTDLLKDVEERAMIEIQRKQQQEQHREDRNTQQRERQRFLANEARNNAAMYRNGTVINGTLIRNGLGSLEEGYGYFPSLVALQFQGSVPPPSASFADVELAERDRLRYILKWLGGITFLLWIFG